MILNTSTISSVHALCDKSPSFFYSIVFLVHKSKDEWYIIKWYKMDKLDIMYKRPDHGHSTLAFVYLLFHSFNRFWHSKVLFLSWRIETVPSAAFICMFELWKKWTGSQTQFGTFDYKKRNINEKKKINICIISFSFSSGLWGISVGKVWIWIRCFWKTDISTNWNWIYESRVYSICILLVKKYT